MLLPKGTTVAVADGEKFNLFSNTGDEANPALTAMPEPNIESVNMGFGASPEQSGQS
jgi:protein required for attachment to host cells